MNNKFLKMAFAGLVFSVSGIASAGLILDQTNDDLQEVGFNGGHQSLTWQQEVIVGVDGQLSAIELFFSTSGSVDFFINMGGGWQNDSHDFESLNMSVVSGLNSIQIDSAFLNVNIGDIFVIGLHGLGQSFDPAFSGTIDDKYAPGTLYINNAAFPIPGYDISFNTFVRTADVPEPSTLAILGLGLMCLAARRFKKQA